MSDFSRRIAELSPAKRDILAQRLKSRTERSPKIETIHRRSAADSLIPLSFAQQRLWFLNQLEPDNSVYNLPAAIRIRGKLDVEALEKSLTQIIARHEVLRTTFAIADGQPAQIINPAQEIRASRISLRHVPEAEREAEALRIAHEELERPFDFARGLLLRVSLLELADDDNVVLLTMHHIITDAWSMDIFTKELTQFYEAYANGTRPSLPELPIQYADFAVWQRGWLQGEALESRLAYWRRQFDDDAPALELPADHPRPAMQTYNGARLIRRLPRRLFDSLKVLSRQEDATLFMLLLASFKTLLYRYCGQDDIVVGSPIANRNRPEIEGLIGFFVNTLALRTKLSGEMTFRDLLKRIRQMTFDAYANQDVPFEKLVDELQLQRELNRAPLFQILFNLQNVGMEDLKLPGVSLTPLQVIPSTAKFDLTLEMSESPEALSSCFEYNSDLFDRSTIVRIADHFETLLEAVIANPDNRLVDLPLISQAEHHQMLSEWNDSSIDYPAHQCLHHLVEAQALYSPHAIAVVFRDDQLDYGELNRRANKLAHYLQRLGVGPDVLVAICMERCLEMVISILAVFKAGGAYVPVDPAYPKQRIAFMLKDASARVLITQQGLIAESLAEHSAVVFANEDWPLIARESEQNPISEVTPENLAYAIYTSGSTGNPKGVMIPHRGILNRVIWVSSVFPLEQSDRLLQKTPFSFDASVWEFFLPLISGAQLIIAEPGGHQESAYLVNAIDEHEITTLQLVPSMLQLLLDEPGIRAVDCLKRVFCGGEALPVRLQERFFDRLDAQLINTYGPTEASIDVTSWNCKVVSDKQRIYIGRSIFNTAIHLLNPNMQPVALGVAGEICIAGTGLARGYLNQPALTAERFVPHSFSDEPGARLYKTGDLARFLADGNIEFLGRIDNQVKLRGFRIEIGEIEATLAASKAVSEAVVIMREDAPGDKRLVAYVVAKESPAPGVSELRSLIKEKLPDYMVPSAFVFMEALPRLPNGKLDRKALPPPDRARPDLSQDYVLPITETERLLSNIWAEVLRLEHVGTHDNFFELGGDSILSIQVVARASQSGLRLTPKQLFQHQTIAELATVVGVAEAAQAEQGIVTGSLPLTPIQSWFFERDDPEPYHWNQDLLLEVRQGFDASLLNLIMKRLLMHHDALRLRFVRHESGWQQFLATPDEAAQVVRFDLSDSEEPAQIAFIEETTAGLHKSVNLSEGPIIQMAYFDLGEQKPGRLLIIIHHLAVDGVSWRVLLEDLRTAYEQLNDGEEIALPSKTTSFKHWAERLQEFAQSETVERELDYWLKVLDSNAPRLPQDYPSELNVEAFARNITVSLDASETQAMLQEALKTYHAQVKDFLLTALALAFSRWTGERKLLVDLEGHGREEIASDIDVSRTIGWFTTIYPVLLNATGSIDTGDALKLVKEQLRDIPNQGINYGLLRYMNDSLAVIEKLRSFAPAQVCFNYMGQFDNVLTDESPFGFASDTGAPSRSRQAKMAYLLEVNVSIDQGQLRSVWTYCEKAHTRQTIERLADDFMRQLRELIAHCRSPEAGGFTPSDFPEAELSQETLDKLLSRIGD